MDDNDLLAADLAYQQSVQYTYVRDYSSVTSWFDHILCRDSLIPRISNVMRLDYGYNLSNHNLIGFTLDFCCSLNVSNDIPPIKPKYQWFKAIPSELESYRNLICTSLSTLPDKVFSCCVVNCTSHFPAHDNYCEKLFTCLLQSARVCIPHYNGHSFHLAGFNDVARNLKTKAIFLHRV